jgi:hypothetical protein
MSGGATITLNTLNAITGVLVSSDAAGPAAAVAVALHCDDLHTTTTAAVACTR